MEQGALYWATRTGVTRGGSPRCTPASRTSAATRVYKLTTRLFAEHDVIVVEDLHVTGTIRNRRLARHISGLGMGEFRHQIEYKATDAGVRVVVADRWYPSSKTCSACGAVKPNSPSPSGSSPAIPAAPGWTGTTTPR
ncbi:MAG: zinc ribbon domain-containing protein [Pseudonocardiales bacterium]